ncbi:hypothetical protein Bpfe_019007 [Biomphalaria pfeifferi]|uniref:Uncharacterized protein n=1 Tax=Biomphalaria pfeifferi TaxID=112525 RepID=A0AAD8F5Q6_BIOPF|nr:hypothetical protein Bpfe_019007 [Biomphalaria pfeifferi]
MKSVIGFHGIDFNVENNGYLYTNMSINNFINIRNSNNLNSNNLNSNNLNSNYLNSNNLNSNNLNSNKVNSTVQTTSRTKRVTIRCLSQSPNISNNRN